MSDEALIVDKTGSVFLAGSYLVKSRCGEDIDNETFRRSYNTMVKFRYFTDNKFPDDASCLDYIKRLFSKIGTFDKTSFERAESKEPAANPKEIYGLIPAENSKQYDMHEIYQPIG